MAIPQNKIFNNKKAYDSGRLRHKIQFMQQTIVDNGYGGETVVETLLLETFAGKDEISAYRKDQLNAGQTTYSNYNYFVIRNRKGFFPDKTMRIVYNDKTYTIITVEILDDPGTFLKIMCQVPE